MVWTVNVLDVSPVAKDRVSVLAVKSVVLAVLLVPMEVATVTD